VAPNQSRKISAGGADSAKSQKAITKTGDHTSQVSSDGDSRAQEKAMNLPLPPTVQASQSAATRLPIQRWEYKHIRLDYLGRGITQEINTLDIDGKRLRGHMDNFTDTNEQPPLPEMFRELGEQGWEMVSHVVNQDNQTNGVTFHYYNFKRPLI